VPYSRAKSAVADFGKFRLSGFIAWIFVGGDRSRRIA